MPDRRALLVAVGGLLAGCGRTATDGRSPRESDDEQPASGRESTTPCPTATASPTPPDRVTAVVAFENRGERPRNVRTEVVRWGPFDGPSVTGTASTATDGTVLVNRTKRLGAEVSGENYIRIYGPDDPKPGARDRTVFRVTTADATGSATIIDGPPAYWRVRVGVEVGPDGVPVSKDPVIGDPPQDSCREAAHCATAVPSTVAAALR